MPAEKSVQDTGIEVTQMAPDIAAKFKNSLRSKRWNKIDLGGTANYTNENMVNRWVIEKNKWLEVSVLLPRQIMPAKWSIVHTVETLKCWLKRTR